MGSGDDRNSFNKKSSLGRLKSTDLLLNSLRQRKINRKPVDAVRTALFGGLHSFHT